MNRVILRADAAERLLAEPGVEPLVARGARAIARNASRIVPRNTGYAAKSYKTTPVAETARGIEATAYTSDYAGHLIEWGSINNPPYAPLRRGAEMTGLRLTLRAKT